MATAALIAVGVLSLIVFVLLHAVVEILRDIRQLRDAMGILDRRLGIDIGPAAGVSPSSYGLPLELDHAKSALVLFLSDRCGTCRTLASALKGRVPAGLWIVVGGASDQAAMELIERSGLSSWVAEGRVMIDPEGSIAGQLGLSTTPAGYRIENGRIRDAATVPSTRTLMMALQNSEPSLVRTRDNSISWLAKLTGGHPAENSIQFKA